MKHVVSFSSGAGSWAAAERVIAEHGRQDVTLLFADTRIEDQDNYRFLVQSASDLAGVRLDQEVAARVRDLPSIADMTSRHSALQALQVLAAERIPMLCWIADGRDPWQVFHDERYLGNTRADPCSKLLKRRLLDRWLGQHCDPADTLAYVGIDWTEEHRFTRLRDLRKASGGWTYKAPLCEAPLLSKLQVLERMATRGLEPPRLYAMGFPHANCGGACIKAGQAHWRLLLEKIPEHYRVWEVHEQALRDELGDVSILRDRRGGGVRALPLAEFRQRVQGGQPTDRHEWGGCGCAVDDQAE